MANKKTPTYRFILEKNKKRTIFRCPIIFFIKKFFFDGDFLLAAA